MMNFSGDVDDEGGIPLGWIAQVNTAPSRGNPIANYRR